MRPAHNSIYLCFHVLMDTLHRIQKNCEGVNSRGLGDWSPQESRGGALVGIRGEAFQKCRLSHIWDQTFCFIQMCLTWCAIMFATGQVINTTSAVLLTRYITCINTAVLPLLVNVDSWPHNINVWKVEFMPHKKFQRGKLSFGTVCVKMQ